MGAFGIIEGHPSADHPPCVETVGDFFEIDSFLLQGAPKPLDEDVVEIATAPIHRDTHTSVDQGGDPCRSSELRALIRVQDLGRTMFGDSFA